MPIKVNLDQLVILLHRKRFLPEAIAEIVRALIESGSIEEAEE